MNKTTAKIRNLKQMAQTINYLREHGLLDLAELQKNRLTNGILKSCRP